MEGLTYLFDVDGTLTAPMKTMNAADTAKFLSWIDGKRAFIVAGSDLEKVQRQIPQSVLDQVEGIFCSSGNELWISGELIYKSDWTPSADFLSYLAQLQKSSHFTPKGKNFREKRTGMVNFSIVGREAVPELREIYYEWDKKNKDREQLALTIKLDYPDLDACIGGQISIDIYPKGQDKSQASKWVRKTLKSKMVFFGDKCADGGNDYSIANDIIISGDGTYHKVESPEQTIKLLENKYSF